MLHLHHTEEDRTYNKAFFRQCDEEDDDEEAKQWSDGPELVDPKQKAILDSDKTTHNDRLATQTLKECDDATLTRIIDITHERAPTKEAYTMFPRVEIERQNPSTCKTVLG
jgi:hypothetical protein